MVDFWVIVKCTIDQHRVSEDEVYHYVGKFSTKIVIGQKTTVTFLRSKEKFFAYSNMIDEASFDEKYGKGFVRNNYLSRYAYILHLFVF